MTNYRIHIKSHDDHTQFHLDLNPLEALAIQRVSEASHENATDAHQPVLMIVQAGS